LLDKGTKKRDAPFGTSLLNCATFALLSADRREAESLTISVVGFEAIGCSSPLDSDSLSLAQGALPQRLGKKPSGNIKKFGFFFTGNTS